MTSDKGFKRAVRARAAKTGESYTTARLRLRGGTEARAPERHRAGNNPEANALRNALARAGVPVSEALVLGAGGGIGAGYLAITHGTTGFMVGSRALWWDSPGFVRAACERLRVPVTIQETTSAKAAVRNVADALAGGALPLAWLDLACLPYANMREFEKCGYHVALVYSLDEAADRAELGDVGAGLHEVTASELARARKSITSFKHRTAVVSAPATGIDLEAAALAGLRACAESLVHGRARTFVLDGFQAWGQAVAGEQGKGAWAALFPPGPDLFRALSSTYRFIETWSGPALLRPLFADFLDEAKTLTSRKALGDVAAHYRECARLWHEVADAALPDGVPELRERRLRLQRREPKPVTPERFPLAAAGIRGLFADLGRRILAAHAAEVEAHAALQAALAN